jgi:hypothetical protein
MESGGVSESRGTESAGGTTESRESGGVSASDRAEVSAAAEAASERDVSAQADAVAGKDAVTDGFDRAEAAAGKAESVGAAAGPGRGPSEGTMSEASRRAEEAESAREAAREATRGEALGLAGAATPERAHRTPSEGTLSEIARRAEAPQVLAIANELGRFSPTARAMVSQFRAAGGRFERIDEGGYFLDDPSRPVIAVGRGSRLEQMQTIAHELGHFQFRDHPQGAYRGPGRPNGVSDRQIEHRRQADYITRNANAHLADEGHATLVNRQIRDEVRARGGFDIGVAGAVPDTLTGPGARSRDAQRAAIGEFFGTHLITSIDRQNYRSYYSEPYRNHYEEHHLPGRER